MSGKKVRSDALCGRFPGDGLGTVFAELKGACVFWVQPSASGAIEAFRLVSFEQRGRALCNDLLMGKRFCNSFECAPAACWRGVSFYPVRSLRAHRRLPATTFEEI